MANRREMKDKSQKLSALAHMSEPVLACWATVLDLCGASELGLATAIGAAIGSTILNVGNQFAELKFDKPNTIDEFFDALDEALDKTKEYLGYSSRRLELIDELINKEFDFDVDLNTMIINAEDLHQKYIQDPDVVVILKYFNAFFREAASTRHSLSLLLIMNSNVSIMERLKKVQSDMGVNAQKMETVIDEVHSVGLNVEEGKKELARIDSTLGIIKGYIERMIMLFATIVRLCMNGLIVFLVFMVLDYTNKESLVDPGMFCMITIGAEILLAFSHYGEHVQMIQRSYALNIWMSHVVIIVVATMLLYKEGAGWLYPEGLYVMIAVLVRYFFGIIPRIIESINKFFCHHFGKKQNTTEKYKELN